MWIINMHVHARSYRSLMALKMNFRMVKVSRNQRTDSYLPKWSDARGSKRPAEPPSDVFWGVNTFRIPVEIDEHTTCNMSCGANLADLVEKDALIRCDEAPMTHMRCFKAAHRSMGDVLSANDDYRSSLLGGKTVLLGEDFRQVLSAVKNAVEPKFLNLASSDHLCGNM